MAGKLDDKSAAVAIREANASASDTTESPPLDSAGPPTKRKWWSWGRSEQQHENNPVARRFAWKLDLIFCSYVFLGYFIKCLDQNSYSNAYVSGMKEDMHMYGNERNLLVTWFGIGIIIGTVPAQMIQLRYVRPSVYMPVCEIIWSALTMSMAAAKNMKTMYALRFFTGLVESCAFPGYAALLGTWYGPAQQVVRQQILEQTTSATSMFSGYLQTALYTGLNGRHGISGWRWMYIFDGIISIPIAIWGFYAIPDRPTNTRAPWLNKEERAYAVESLNKIGRVASKPLTWKMIKAVYLSKYIWVFVAAYTLLPYGGNGSGYFNLWLKAEGYSVKQVNLIPTAGNALTIVSAVIFGAYADYTGRRISAALAVAVVNTIANIMLSIWYIPKRALFVAQFMTYIGPILQPFIIAYGNEIFQFNSNLRQLLVATGNIFTYTFSAFTGVALFPTYDAPHYKYAYQIMILFTGLGSIAALWLKLIGIQLESGKDNAVEYFRRAEEEDSPEEQAGQPRVAEP